TPWTNRPWWFPWLPALAAGLLPGGDHGDPLGLSLGHTSVRALAQELGQRLLVRLLVERHLAPVLCGGGGCRWRSGLWRGCRGGLRRGRNLGRGSRWSGGRRLSWSGGGGRSWSSGRRLSWSGGGGLSWSSGRRLSWSGGGGLSWSSGRRLSWSSGG